MVAGKILIVATSHDKLGDSGQPTGSWVEEVAAPYLFWKEAGYKVEIASIKGGEVPFDPASKEGDACTPEAKAFLENVDTQAAVKNTKAISDVLSDAEAYDAVFLPGGHGVCWDLPQSKELRQLLERMWSAGKVVSAVCHGPVGLTTAEVDGKPLVSGRSVAGFSNAEERAVGKEGYVPFLLEDKLKELGGKYSSGPDWQVHAVRDGRLVTGQNPASSRRVAELVHEALSAP